MAGRVPLIRDSRGLPVAPCFRFENDKRSVVQVTRPERPYAASARTSRRRGTTCNGIAA
jgi:hypothetical protein